MTAYAIYNLIDFVTLILLGIGLFIPIWIRQNWLRKKNILDKTIQRKSSRLQFYFDCLLTAFFLRNAVSCAVDALLFGSIIGATFFFINVITVTFMIHKRLLVFGSHLRVKPFDYNALNYYVMIGMLYSKIPHSKVDISKYPGDARTTYCHDCGRKLIFDHDAFIQNAPDTKATNNYHLRIICDECYNGEYASRYRNLEASCKHVERTSYTRSL